MAPDAKGNRATLLTPPGAAAIAVVRIAGPNVESFLRTHFAKPVSAGRCVHGDLVDGPRTIDDPVVVLAEDRQFADISLHGGTWVVLECLELARRAGFEIVENTDDLIDGDDIIEREMLAALPLARTEPAVRMLLAQPALWKSLDQHHHREMFSDCSLWWMLHPPKVAIVGVPNVGKSTLANQLFGQQRSITADVPGTTRDWVGDLANLDGLPIHLIDTPGQRESADPIEQAAIVRSRAQIDQADLVLLVLDPNQPLEPDQRGLRSRYPSAMLVLNKIDLPPTGDIDETGAIRTVATTGAGIDELRRSIREHFNCDDLTIDRPRWWTQRQRNLLEEG